MNEISLHILDIVQNSIAAGATKITIEIVEDPSQDTLTVTVADNGCGMDSETVVGAQDPFTTSRTTRKVGLGIPLFKAGCLGCGGQFSIDSAKGVGTTICGGYRMSHIDTPPLGDIAGTVYLLIAANPEIEIMYRHKVACAMQTFDTHEVRSALDGVPINHPDVLEWVRQSLNEMENDLHGGAKIE